MSYVNLYTQTEYSLLNSSIRIKDLPKAAKEMGYEALGIADNNLSGVVKFYKECHNVGIKPIIGLRLELQSDYVLLYAKNNLGYVNLLKIRTIKGTKLKISIDDIKEYLHDLVVIIPGDESNFVKAYISRDFIQMQKVLRDYLRIKNNHNISLYLGLDVQTKDNKYMLGDLIYLAKQNGIAPVAIRKTNYLKI